MGYKVGNGIDQYMQSLTNLATQADEIAKRGIYDGMAVVADAIRSNIGGIPTGNGKDGKITPEQKEGLSAGLGISQIRNKGGVFDAKTGFAGTNANGEKNATVARKVESGTSKVRKYSFVSKAGASARGAAEQAIAKTIDDEINKIMK